MRHNNGGNHGDGIAAVRSVALYQTWGTWFWCFWSHFPRQRVSQIVVWILVQESLSESASFGSPSPSFFIFIFFLTVPELYPNVI